MAESEDYKYEVYLENVDTPVFKQRFTILFARDPYEALYETEMIQSFADSFFDGDYDGATQDLKRSNAMCINIHSKSMLILVIPFTVTAGVIAHECLHLARMILRNRDIPFSDDTEEVYAYLLDYLVEEITEMVKSVKRSRREKNKKK